MKLRGNLAILLAAMAAGLALTPSPAHAYIGIGGSLSVVAAALGMVAAFAVSSFMVMTAPLRALKNWLTGTPGQPTPSADTEAESSSAEAKPDQPAGEAEKK